jgi:phage-related minor tail protein
LYVENAPQKEAQLHHELTVLRHRLRELENAEEVTLEELQYTAEQLRVAEEELRQQQDELIKTRQQVAVERQRYAALFDFPIGGFSPPAGRLARGFKPPAFSRFLFQSAVKSAESF